MVTMVTINTIEHRLSYQLKIVHCELNILVADDYKLNYNEYFI